jgi:membrane fusion protein, multidrug efflux system
MLIMVALLVGGPGGCSSDGQSGNKSGGSWGAVDDTQPGPDQRVLVEVAGIEIGTVADHLITTGVLESEAQADITPLGSGTVTRVMAEEGDTVRPGQVLAVIENVSLASGADRATIELNNAKQAVAEAESLHSRGAISDRELRDANSALAVANAGYKEARASAGFTRLTSPIAGTVSLRNVRVGEVAQPSQPAFQVVDLDRLRVIVQLPEKDLPRVSTGLPATLTGAYDEEAGATGQVERISPVVQASSGTVRVTIGVDSENASLRPGQFVKVRIEVDRHSDVLTIPRRSLVWDDGEPVAWTVFDAPAPEPPEEEALEDADDEGGWMADLFGDGEDGEDAEDAEDRDEWEGIPRRGVVKNRLEIGFVDPDWVEVVSGLAKTDQVITLGNGSLREETLVRLVGDPDPPEREDDAEQSEDGKKKKKRKGKRRGEG